MAAPQLFPAQPLVTYKEGEPPGWFINPPPTDSWTGPVLSVWEMHASFVTDEHVHDEYVYVLEGDLVVECDGNAVSLGKGDAVRVPGGSIGTYRADTYAKLMSVYGANPHGVAVKVHEYSPVVQD